MRYKISNVMITLPEAKKNKNLQCVKPSAFHALALRKSVSQFVFILFMEQICIIIYIYIHTLSGVRLVVPH